jgi:hypothetical protein
MEITLTTKMIVIVIISFGIAIFIAWLLGFFTGKNKNKNKKNKGEAAVRELLTIYCRNSTAHLLNNVTIKHEDGTTQIDHILITQNGVLVIETKHYSGWLFAIENDRQWTQVFYRVKFRFQNPIHQNMKHVHAVQQLLSFIPKEQVQGLVVFTGDAIFKTNIPKGVININQLEAYVDGMRFGQIPENKLQYCVGRIECHRLEITGKTDVEHQLYLENKYGIVD